ncbi:MAG TPA: 1,6-anhydro-N-acetylmuramyl-L-alanine amidase AmpD [Steroidobacteraceae bacterium]|nr:1,6-anhydro-N-acetylmuramyl-L-alanine amidase AmpD [Steroidobacteraceae bacterium]
MMPGAVTTGKRKRRGASARAWHVDRVRGRLPAARQVPSPNCDARPGGAKPSLIVIHGISLPPGKFGGPWIERLFTNRLPADRHPFFRGIATLRVSSHLVIRRGGRILQFVPFHRRAWHAGISSYEGRGRCNDFSIGIELEGTDRRAYTDAQYRVLTRVLRTLLASYPGLAAGRIVGHSDIAPGRKTDPGPAFDWKRLRAALESGPAG